MKRSLTLALVAASLAASAALAQPGKVELKKIPDAIKSLDWKSVDFAAASQLERTRALILLDDTLDELGAQMTAEADLMSEFIDQKNLGPDFAAIPEVADPPKLNMQQARQVAVALLRGPMANSPYATEIADAEGTVLLAYEQMYTTSCDRKWATAAEARYQARAMTRYLNTSKKMEEYTAWVPGEVKRRTEEAQAAAAAKRAVLQAQKKEEQLQREQAAEERKQKQAEQQAQAAAQMQQALSVAQDVPSSSGGYDDSYYYGGGAYLGAAGLWYRDNRYRGEAPPRVEQRMSNWRGGGGGGGRGGARGGGRR